MKTAVYIGFGSNVGNRAMNIIKAMRFLTESPHIRISKVSSLYETEPVGYKDQGWFLNGVAQIETDLPPTELLDLLKDTEARLKRKPTFRWGPRVIDMDILLYDDLSFKDDSLQIPHPRMWERAFVLAPLSEIAPQARRPDGRTVNELFRELPKSDAVGFFSYARRPQTIVHRTKLPGLPENSLNSIRQILRLDYPDWIEIDIALTKDGQMALIHDETLDRTTTGEGEVSSKTYDELKKLKIKNPDGVPEDEGVPTVDEALELFDGARPALQIDAKDLDDHRAASDLVGKINRSGIKDRVIITSVNFRLLRQLRHLDPTIRLGYDPQDMYEAGLIDKLRARHKEEKFQTWKIGPKLIENLIGRAKEIRAEAVYLDHRLFFSDEDGWGAIEGLHEKGIEVDVWTANEEKRMKELIEIGVDRITTDRADLLKELVGTGF
jgi:2-amino-4-hydroxy-6-hydroxymethyldihydropteridine diphosphokinase